MLSPWAAISTTICGVSSTWSAPPITNKVTIMVAWFLTDLPPGRYVLQPWHPRLRGRAERWQQEIVIEAASEVQTIALDLRAGRRSKQDAARNAGSTKDGRCAFPANQVAAAESRSCWGSFR